ncbi:LamG-like jellyroll fold domain-containing protein [Fibrella aestuarina]|nr:LamG-like jellyroll fold domain-containing protein [Fibrella aestuarina]
MTSLKVLMAFVLLFSVFQACKKDDGPTVDPVNTTALRARIDSANTLYNGAKEGTAVGSYEVGSRATYKTAIDAATSVLNNTASTQTQVNNAYVNLGQATTTFRSKQVAEIAPDKLVLFLKLDGNANDASGKGLSGSLVAGASGVGSDTANVGGGMATLTTDRLGQANLAYMFDKGGHIEIPYNSALNPAKELTISMWVKPTVIRADNYLVSMGRWNGYKLQLQSANKVFLTVKTAPGKYSEHDNESPTLDLNKWYHIAATYKSGEMVFYIDGTAVKTWTDVTGDPIGIKNTIGMSIGQDLPNANYTNVATDEADGTNFYRGYGGYFTGAMDEIRIYNAVLSGTQIRSIYNAEKSL